MDNQFSTFESTAIVVCLGYAIHVFMSLIAANTKYIVKYQRNRLETLQV